MLVGRNDQIAAITAVIDKARDGKSGALMIAGEPGAGKTTLLERAGEIASSDTLLSVRGAPPDATLSFAGLLQVVRPLSDQLANLASDQAAVLRSACGLTSADIADRHRVHVAVLLLLAAAAEQRPVVVTADDIQWLDVESRDALLFAARRLDFDAVAMLFACRTGETSREDIVSTAHLPILHLGGLSESAAAELLGACCGVRPQELVVSALVAATGGNPLALVEIAEQLSAEQLRGTEPLPAALPLHAAADQAYARLLDRLPAATLDLLGLFALAEGDDAPSVVAAAADLGMPRDALTDLESRKLVNVGGGRVHLRHALLVTAATARLTVHRRYEMHRAIAAALRRTSDVGEPMIRRAWHLAEATHTPDADVAAMLTTIAGDRRHTTSSSAAARTLERAATLTPDRPTRANRFQAAADAAAIAGYAEWSLRLLASARELVDDQVTRARLDHALGVRHIVAGRCHSAWTVLPAAADVLQPTDKRQAAVILADAALAAFLAGYLTDARDTADRARQLSEQPDIQLAAGVVNGLTRMHLGDLDHALPLLSAPAALPDLFDRLTPIIEYVVPLTLGLTWAGAHDAAIGIANQVIALLRTAGAYGVLPAALYASAYANAWQGRLHTSYLLASEAKALADEGGNRQWQFLATGCLALVEAMRGNLPECRQLAAIARTKGTDTELWHPRDVQDALGIAALCEGDHLTAVRHLESAALPQPLAAPFFGRPSTADLVESWVRTDHEVPDGIASWIEASPPEQYPAVAGMIWRCRAVLGTHDPDDAFEAATTRYATARLPWQEARTQLAYGERLRRAGRRLDARQHLRHALHLFEDTESAAWADRAARELTICGGEPQRAVANSVADLTPQELQIALTVAGGATNREAASVLFLSPKTVEMHLTHIYRKLGMRSRTDLVARFARST